MHIQSLTLLNWGPFRGSHRLDLGPTAYGIFAQRRGNAESSNWAGKTMLLEAVEWCLGGWQNKHRRHGADGWISDGEKSGGVQLVLSDGTNVGKHRDKGKTTLSVGAATGDDAQEKLDALLGLSREDRMASCFLQQREAARLVLAEPSERLAVVSSWLRLDRLDGAVDIAAERLKAEVVADRGVAEKARVAQAMLDQHLAGETAAALADKDEELRSRLAVLDEERAAVVACAELRSRVVRARERVAEYERLVAEGKALAADPRIAKCPELKVVHEDVLARLNEAVADSRVAQDDEEQKRKLAAGKFDGLCPVALIECPAKAEINSAKKRSLKLYEEAKKVRVAAEDLHAELYNAERWARAELQEAQRLIDRLEDMRERARKMRVEYEEARSLLRDEDSVLAEDVEDRARGVQERRAAVVAEKAQVQARIAGVKRARAALEEAEARRSPRVVVLRESASVLAQARRRVAEGAVADIESIANEKLAAAGIDLGVRLSWEREGGDLARACAECGAPFPKSAKVKQCESCGAARGQSVVSKFEVELTRRSGAAEDLAGIALRLAASEWLRRDRASAWAVASMDEPFAQADAANRRALGLKLWPMLRAAGFAQALVVSHTPDVLRALPGRIEVESDGKWSSARVA